MMNQMKVIASHLLILCAMTQLKEHAAIRTDVAILMRHY